jgi:hypothetical protein
VVIMRARAVLAASLLAPPLASCGACEPGSTSSAPAGDGGSAWTGIGSTATTSALAAAASSHRHPWADASPPPSRLFCRAMDVRGDVRREGAASDDSSGDGGTGAGDAGATITTLAELPHRGWLTLAAGARLVAKDPRNGRETNFEGPARVRPCVGADEETWVAAGTFASSPGAGEAPGAEEWVVTPLGLVRYGTGSVKVVVAPADVTVTVGSGVSWLWPAGGATSTMSPLGDAGPPPAADAGSVEGWMRLEGVVAHVRGRPRPTPAGAAKACAALAQTAHDDAAAVLAGEAGPALVSSQVVERRLARAACAVAQLLLETAPSPVDPDLAHSAAVADSAWRALPLPQ